MPAKDITNSEQEDFIDSAKEIPFSKLASLSRSEKLRLIALLNKLLQENVYEIPLTVFQNDFLSALETIVKYLHENLNLSFVEIAKLLNRSDKTIWVTYQNSKKKMTSKFYPVKTQYYIPVSAFADRNYSTLESLVAFLRETYGLSYSEIAKMLNRNYTTIVTVSNRHKKKTEDKST